MMDPFPVKEPWEWWFNIWYPVYQKSMTYSSYVQDWADNEGPWGKTENTQK